MRKVKGAQLTPSMCGILLDRSKNHVSLTNSSRIDVTATELKGTTPDSAIAVGSLMGMRRPHETEQLPTEYNQIAMYKARGISTKEAVDKLAQILRKSPKEISVDSDYPLDVNGTQILHLENSVKYGSIVKANLAYQTMIQLKWNSTIGKFMMWYTDNEKQGKSVIPRRLDGTVSPKTAKYLRFHPYGSSKGSVPYQGQLLKITVPGIVIPTEKTRENIRYKITQKIEFMRLNGCGNFFDSSQCVEGTHYANIAWNILASLRLRLSSDKVLKGDIVIRAPEDDRNSVSASLAKRIESVEEAKRYRISDVVLPIPIHGKPLQSTEEIIVTGKTKATKQLLLPTHLSNPPGDPYINITKIVSDNFNYEGHCMAYRRLVVVPRNVNFNFMTSYMSNVDDFSPPGTERVYDSPLLENLRFVCRLPPGASHVSMLSYIVGDDLDDQFKIF